MALLLLLKCLDAFFVIVVFKSLSYVWLFETPWPATCQAPLSFTIFGSLLNFISVELVMLSNRLILYCPLLFCLWSFPASGSFPMSQFIASGDQSIGASASASVVPMNFQGWFPLTVWSPCCPSSTLSWFHEQVRHGNFDDKSLDCDLRRYFLSLVPPPPCPRPPPNHSVGETGSLQGVEVAFLPTWDKPLVKFFSMESRPFLWNSTDHRSEWLFFQSSCQRQ